MSKQYYPLEEAINNVYKALNIAKKDAYKMTQEEFMKAEREIDKYVIWVKHDKYMQFVPRLIKNGELILPEE